MTPFHSCHKISAPRSPHKIILKSAVKDCSIGMLLVFLLLFVCLFVCLFVLYALICCSIVIEGTIRMAMILQELIMNFKNQ